MTRENYLELKAELKELAKSLKINKKDFRTTQSKYSTFERDHRKELGDRGYKNSKAWEKLYPLYRDLSSKENSLYITVKDQKYEFRHKHIMYCLARGKTYEQIEQKTRDGNEPNWSYINCLKKQYGFDEVEKEKEKEEALV